MRFYELFFDDEDNPYWNTAINEDALMAPTLNIWAYKCCQRIENPMLVPVKLFTKGIPADCDLDTLTSSPIVSRQLANLLNEIAADDVQLIPAVIDAPGEWFVVNVLHEIDAINYERSLVQFHDMDHPRKPGKPSGIIRLIVDPQRTGRHQIFRLKDWRVAVIVSERVKEACQRANMTNMQFIPTSSEEWEEYNANPNDERWCHRHYLEK